MQRMISLYLHGGATLGVTNQSSCPLQKRKYLLGILSKIRRHLSVRGQWAKQENEQRTMRMSLIVSEGMHLQ